MKQYKCLMLGFRSAHADECYKGGFIGADIDIDQDLTHELPENWRDFNKKFIPIWLEKHPGKSKVAAGLACGMLWTVSKGLSKGDVILSPDGNGNYYSGEISSDYSYHPGKILPHRREIVWYPGRISRESMTRAFQNSTRSIGTIADITKYAEEIDGLIGNVSPPKIVSTDDTIEDPVVFALEKHLEEFLVKNWAQTELGKEYDIYEVDGEVVGQQFQTDTGPMDILAISKDKGKLLVVELKKGRVSDNVVGQVQRYMGYVQEDLAEKEQVVKGVIIALEDDLRIKRALSVAPNIDFYRYEVNFSLIKG
ncbi:MAG: endonuclease NucS domain-containing protein [Bacteroidota bacterium]